MDFSNFWQSLPQGWQPWGGILIALAAAVAVALLAHAVVFLVLKRLAGRTRGVADTSAIGRTRRPARWVLLFLALQIALPQTLLAEADAAMEFARHLLSIALIASVTWLVIGAVSVIDDVAAARYPMDKRDNLRARQIQTQAAVLSRTLMVVVAVIGFAGVLMTFEQVRQLGVSLLASAGIAGIVVGMAARPALSNLIAGLQLALSQPIRLDDVVIVEGEWGRIEEITTTYVVVRIWDERRLVVPLGHFIEKPFQNWTRTSAQLLGTVFIYADYSVPVQAVREELRRMVKDIEQWDGRVCVLQVTNTGERTMEMRALVSAEDSGKAWELRCEIRERMIEFLQKEYPDSLPKVRAELQPRESGESLAAESLHGLEPERAPGGPEGGQGRRGG